MPFPKPPDDDTLGRVAELRAAGQSWAATAAAVRIGVRTIERWPAKYPFRWAVATAAAIEKLRTDSRFESMTALRHQLRSRDEAVRAKAADVLLRHTAPKRPVGRRRGKPGGRKKLSPQLHAIAAELEGLTDADLDKLLAELLPDLLPNLAVRPPAEGGDGRVLDARPAGGG